MNWWKLRSNVHSSWLISLLSCGILIGVIVSQYVLQSIFSSFSYLLLALLIITISFVIRSNYIVPLIIIGGIILGLWRGSVDQTQLAIYQNLYGQNIKITAKVSEDIDRGKNEESIIRLTDINIMDRSLKGKIWVSSSTKADIKRGDLVNIEGKISPGFGSFSASIYQARLLNLKRPEPGDPARQVRDWFAESIRGSITEPEASLGIGYLLGQRRSLPLELENSLIAVGLMHIVVASGYNLTILVRMSRRIFMRVSRYTATLAASTMIIGFIAITGSSPSMFRAGIIAGLSLAAWYYGRKFHPLVLLPFVASITVIVEPSYMWGDLGWQLSFASFAGVMILAPLLQAYFFSSKNKPGTIRQILGETISAQIATLPIIILAFGQFSNVSIIANLLVLPFVPLAMLLSFIAGITTLIAPGLALIIGLPAFWVLHYMTTIATFLSSLSWAQSTMIINFWWVVVYYLMLIIFCLYISYKTKFDLRQTNIVE